MKGTGEATQKAVFLRSRSMAKGKNTTISGAGAVKMLGSTPIAGGRCAFFEVVKARLFETYCRNIHSINFLY